MSNWIPTEVYRCLLCIPNRIGKVQETSSHGTVCNICQSSRRYEARADFRASSQDTILCSCLVWWGVGVSDNLRTSCAYGPCRRAPRIASRRVQCVLFEAYTQHAYLSNNTFKCELRGRALRARLQDHGPMYPTIVSGSERVEAYRPMFLSALPHGRACVTHLASTPLPT